MALGISKLNIDQKWGVNLHVNSQVIHFQKNIFLSIMIKKITMNSKLPNNLYLSYILVSSPKVTGLTEYLSVSQGGKFKLKCKGNTLYSLKEGKFQTISLHVQK